MSNLKMGNVSRTADEIKKKLEVSFRDDTEIHTSGNSEKSKVSRNTEVHKSINTEIGKSENRYKKVMPRLQGKPKAKATFCLDALAVEQLNEVYIKRLSTNQKSDRSSLICEAISLLFEKEMGQF